MAKEFAFATEESVVSVRSRASLGSQVTQNKDRTQTYRRWSEKATVIRYKKDVDAYDIIVSTTSVSSSTKKTERTMRAIRAIIPTSVHQFKPGDSVLIGYVFERRETPVILGVRVASSGALRSPTNLNVEITGEGGTPLCDLRCFAEDGDGDSVLISGGTANFECTDDGPTGTGGLSFRVECATGIPQWRWDGTEECKTDGCFTSSASEGEGSTRFSIAKNFCLSLDPDTELPFSNSIAAYVRLRSSRWETDGGSCQSNLAVDYFSCTGSLVAQRGVGCGFGGECGDGVPEDICCGSVADEVEEAAGNVGETFDLDFMEALLPKCGPTPNTGNVPTFNDVFAPLHDSVTTIENCGWFDYQSSGTNLLVETSQDQIDILNSNGCCPCSIVSGTSVTVRDSSGRSCTITLKHHSPTVTEVGSNPSNAGPCTGSN